MNNYTEYYEAFHFFKPEKKHAGSNKSNYRMASRWDENDKKGFIPLSIVWILTLVWRYDGSEIFIVEMIQDGEGWGHNAKNTNKEM